MTKHCGGCDRDLPEAEWQPSHWRKKTGWCRSCLHEYTAQRREQRLLAEAIANGGTTRCSRCGEHKLLGSFSQSAIGGWCRDCYREDHRAKRAAGIYECKDCGERYTPWQPWGSNAGAAGSRCHECYLEYTRRRQTKKDGVRQRNLTPDWVALDEERGNRPKGPGWSVRREQVLAEETHCGVCGELVDKDRHGVTDPLGPNVDHIVPLAMGGHSYRRSNLQLTHKECNRVKAAGEMSQAKVLHVAMARAALWLADAGF